MVKSVGTAHLHQEEEDEDDYEDKVETVRVEGKGSEQKTNTNRAKHSETEQRRRSKINERFQALRDLIPQNDQKRDKASFLLEVIEYIQFLQEKLQIYEGSYQGWSQEPTKLIPWRNHHGLAESFTDHSQVMKNGSSSENDVVIPPMLANTQNSIESDLGNAVLKPLDHPLRQLLLWLTCTHNQTHLLHMEEVASLQIPFISLCLIPRTWYIDPNFRLGKVEIV